MTQAHGKLTRAVALVQHIIQRPLPWTLGHFILYHLCLMAKEPKHQASEQ